VCRSDGILFTSSGRGHLVVTFPNTDEGASLVIDPEVKKVCPWIVDTVQNIGIEKIYPGGTQFDADLTIEVLDDKGDWVGVSSPIPSREDPTQEIVLANIAAGITGEVLTVRLSWQEGYSTDAVLLCTSAEETPIVKAWEIDSFGLTPDGTITE
jgi:hypothetical protein